MKELNTKLLNFTERFSGNLKRRFLNPIWSKFWVIFTRNQNKSQRSLNFIRHITSLHIFFMGAIIARKYLSKVNHKDTWIMHLNVVLVSWYSNSGQVFTQFHSLTMSPIWNIFQNISKNSKSQSSACLYVLHKQISWRKQFEDFPFPPFSNMTPS